MFFLLYVVLTFCASIVTKNTKETSRYVLNLTFLQSVPQTNAGYYAKWTWIPRGLPTRVPHALCADITSRYVDIQYCSQSGIACWSAVRILVAVEPLEPNVECVDMVLALQVSSFRCNGVFELHPPKEFGWILQVKP